MWRLGLELGLGLGLGLGVVVGVEELKRSEQHSQRAVLVVGTESTLVCQ